jgi:hypothetical protein
MKYFKLFLLLFYFQSASLAQNITYGGMQFIGVAVEKDIALPTFTLINGIRYKHFFAGIGLSFETASAGFYSPIQSSLPIFLDARYYIGQKKRFYTLVDGGLTFVKKSEWMTDTELQRYHQRVGTYGNIGIGVKAKLGKEVYYSFEICSNYKKTGYDLEYLNFLEEWNTEEIRYKQNRILIRFGIEIL